MREIAEGATCRPMSAVFGRDTANALVAPHRADLTAANNVLAHVPDIADFVSGFAILLKPEASLPVEFPTSCG